MSENSNSRSLAAQAFVVIERKFDTAQNEGVVTYPLIDIPKEEDIKAIIETNLPQRGGHVLVKWNNKLFVCEPCKSSKMLYTKTQVGYHPLQDHFTI